MVKILIEHETVKSQVTMPTYLFCKAYFILNINIRQQDLINRCFTKLCFMMCWSFRTNISRFNEW